MVGDDWDLVLKAATFKIFMKYKETFAWTYKDFKGIPLELCMLKFLLVLGAQSVRERPYIINKE